MKDANTSVNVNGLKGGQFLKGYLVESSRRFDPVPRGPHRLCRRPLHGELRLDVGTSTESHSRCGRFFSTNCYVSSEARQKERGTVYERAKSSDFVSESMVMRNGKNPSGLDLECMEVQDGHHSSE